MAGSHRAVRSGLILTAGLLAALAAVSCGGQPGAGADADATALVEERLPTLQAQMTDYAAQVTQSAPTVQAIMTLAATSGPLDPLALTPPQGSTPAPGGESPGAAYGDVNQTTGGGPIAPGQTVTGNFATATEAHNYTLQGSAGQTLTIRVAGDGISDPRVKVFDPAGSKIAEDDDSGGAYGALLTVTLPAAGEYIIRVDTWGGGAYTLTVQ